MHRAVVIGDDVHALEEDRLDRVLPGPQRQRVIAQRPKIRVEHQGRKTSRRNVHVQATLLDLLKAAATQLTALVIGQRDRIVKPERAVTRKAAICGAQSMLARNSPPWRRPSWSMPWPIPGRDVPFDRHFERRQALGRMKQRLNRNELVGCRHGSAGPAAGCGSRPRTHSGSSVFRHHQHAGIADDAAGATARRKPT